MGMFDWLTCKYKLDDPVHNTLRYQTKDTRAQGLDNYEIREDGTLWHENYDANWVDDGNYKLFGGYLEKSNLRWEQEIFTGEIIFYANTEDPNHGANWIEYSAYYRNGELQQINRTE